MTESPANASPPDLPPDVEQHLRELSNWPGEPTKLWQAALESRDRSSWRGNRASRGGLRFVIPGLAVAAILMLVASATWNLTGTGEKPPPLAMKPEREYVGRIAVDSDGVPAGLVAESRKYPMSPAPTQDNLYPADLTPPRQVEEPRADRLAEFAGKGGGSSAADRSVIRKATIELAVGDAREVFAKCQHLLRADLGEFVEGSSLTGQDKDTRAQLTLRVAAAGGRIDEVLNSLRTLGKVDSENATGDDVSAQVVDLDAHLRNEKQVEAEVLKLLETRKDAQLKDILELRDKLSSIRGTIEQLQGRRDTLGRQIALASILVLIRPDNAEKPEPPKPGSMLDHFTKEVSAAWTSGLNALTATIAFLINIAVGGLVWWLLLFAAIAIARRAIRRWLPDPAAVPTA